MNVLETFANLDLRQCLKSRLKVLLISYWQIQLNSAKFCGGSSIQIKVARRLKYHITVERADRFGTFHREGHQRNWLLNQAQNIRLSAGNTQQSQTMCEHNARAIERYHGFFSGKKFSYLPPLSISTSMSGIQVNVNPDLHVIERGKTRIIRIEYAVRLGHSRQQFQELAAQIVSEAISQRSQSLGLKPSDIQNFDLKDGSVYKAKSRTRIRNQITAACLNIASLWPTI